MDQLVIHPDRMQKNLDQMRGLVHSQRVLLALTQKGASREAAYEMVQRNATKVWEEHIDFLETLMSDPEVVALISQDELAQAFDLGYHTKNVSTIFERVFNASKQARRVAE
jgi:adenylosuccinate lyase